MGHHHHERTTGRALSLAFALNFLLLLVEGAVGLLTGSLALLADAMHMLSDVSALAVAWVAHKLGKDSNSRKAEIIGASINGLALLGACFFILREGVDKLLLGSAVAIMGWPVLIVAVLGLAVNIISYFVLVKNAKRDLNVRSAIGHMMADALGSVGVIVAAIFIILGFPIADTIVAIIVGCLVMYTAIDILRSCGKVILSKSWDKETICEKGCHCED